MALFRKYAKRVYVDAGKFYWICHFIIYPLLTKHEVKKLDILRFMDRKFPIIFTLIWGGVLHDETKSAGRQSEY